MRVHSQNAILWTPPPTPLARRVTTGPNNMPFLPHGGRPDGSSLGWVPLSTIHWALLGTINMGYIHEIYWANTYNINRAKSAIYME